MLWLSRLLFITCCVSIFSTAMAKTEQPSDCSLLNVSIRNDSNNDCVIKRAYLALGAFAKKSQFPEVIFRGKEASFSVATSFIDKFYFLHTAIFMDLQCGDDQKITLFTATPTLRHSSVLDQKNMTAEFTQEDCNNVKGQSRPWTIQWILQPAAELIA